MGCVVSSIPVAFFKFKQQPQLYRMYAIQRQFNQDQAKINKCFSSKEKKKTRRKKTIKKLVNINYS